VLINLDKKDTAILKGLAISAIVFHNFFHVLSPVHENEFTFDPQRFPVFLQNVIHPATAIQALFSFYGHYGVQIFIFLTAYGLAKTHWDDSESWSSFMWSRIKKFYPMFLLVVMFWAILASIQMGPGWVICDAGPGLIFTLAGISNLMPGSLPIVGPWWFIPFIMQVYAIWPLLRKLTKRFGWQGLLALALVCYAVTYLANPALSHWSILLGTTPIGRMRILCFGIIAARYPLRLNLLVALPAAACLLLGSRYGFFAPTASLGFTISALWVYAKLRAQLRKWDLLEQLGNYSLAIFLLNGIVRIPFIRFAEAFDSPFPMAFATASVTFATAVLFHHILAPGSRMAEPRKIISIDSPLQLNSASFSGD
jgi:peptidoglycan/LPS O-acetylase OafA/YrhL